MSQCCPRPFPFQLMAGCSTGSEIRDVLMGIRGRWLRWAHGINAYRQSAAAAAAAAAPAGNETGRKLGVYCFERVEINVSCEELMPPTTDLPLDVITFSVRHCRSNESIAQCKKYLIKPGNIGEYIKSKIY